MQLKIRTGLLAAVGAAALAGGASAQPAASPGLSASKPVYSSASIKDDVSPPLRDMQLHVNGERHSRRSIENPVRPLPLPKQDTSPGGLAENAQTVQSAKGLTTKDQLNFAGVGNGDYGFEPDAAPPDTNGAIGDTQYVQFVNESFAVFDKNTGDKLLGPISGNTLWSGFGGGCETNDDGDIIAQYDKAAHRWVLGQFSVSTTPYLMCVAVSDTNDATGKWHRYAFNYGPADFPDYPKIGVWPDGYYTTYNVFGPASFEGSRVCAFDRKAMLKGKTATQQCVQLSSSFGGLLPSDADGATAPPAGSPNFLVALGTNKSLLLWRYSVDWSNPLNTTLSAPISIRVPAYKAACNGGACIPQPGTKVRLDSLADRLMYRLAYRNFGDHEALVVNHSVTVNGGSGVRWYELRDPNGSPALFQSGTFAPADGLSRWMGSVAMDKKGNLAVGYSASSKTEFPSIYYTGRLASDPLGQLGTEKLVQAGAGSQTTYNGGTPLQRWGDYSGMTVDPKDDCTFYYTTEYLKDTGVFNWSTKVNSFKFKSCK